MEHSQTYRLRVRDDKSWWNRHAGGCVLLWTDQNRPMEKNIFVSTLFWREQCEESKNHYAANTMLCSHVQKIKLTAVLPVKVQVVNVPDPAPIATAPPCLFVLVCLFDDELMKETGTWMWLLWIEQNRPMEKYFLSAFFEENSVGNQKKPEWTNTKSTTTTTPSITKKNSNLQKNETSPTRWNTAKLTPCVCETTSWR